jgi:hypothetical protein
MTCRNKKIFRVLRSLTAVLSALFFLAGETTARAQQFSQLPDAELASRYGTLLRAQYTGVDFDFSELGGLEAEISNRRLFSSLQVVQIEKGVVFVGMPLTQLLASMDGLKQSDYAERETFTLRAYMVAANAQDRFANVAMAAYRHRMPQTQFVLCNERVVAMYVRNALIAPDSVEVWGAPGIVGEPSLSPGDGVYIQTTFQPGFWNESNRSMRQRFQRILNDPHAYFLISRDGPWGGLWTNQMGKRGGPRTAVALRSLEEFIASHEAPHRPSALKLACKAQR